MVWPVSWIFIASSKGETAMLYLDLIVLIIVVSVIAIWLDRRFVRNRRDTSS
jgi:hypothetical protein